MPHTWSNEGLSGQPLRYVVCLALAKADGRALTMPEIIAAVGAFGLPIAGRASKTVSDALRTEVNRGRVRRVGRGRYRSDRPSESTLRWMQGWLVRRKAALAESYAAQSAVR